MCSKVEKPKSGKPKSVEKAMIPKDHHSLTDVCGLCVLFRYYSDPLIIASILRRTLLPLKMYVFYSVSRFSSL